jgi:hypothetical protein
LEPEPVLLETQPREDCVGYLTEFTAEVRRLLDRREKETGRHIQLSAGVQTRPGAALVLGFDVLAWVHSQKLNLAVYPKEWHIRGEPEDV